jgi:hypothetical protein
MARSTHLAYVGADGGPAALVVLLIVHVDRHPAGRILGLNLCEAFLPRRRKSTVVRLSRSFAISLSQRVPFSPGRN